MTSRSSVLSQNCRNSWTGVRAASSQIVPASGFPHFAPDAVVIRVDLIEREQRALLRLAAGIADHAGAAAGNRNRRVAVALQARQSHKAEQITDVQARRRRIETDVGGDALVLKRIRQPIG